MNFVTYFDNRFQEVSVRQAQQPQFSAVTQGHVNACRRILTCYFFFFELLWIPVALVGFVLMKLHLASKPGPRLAEVAIEDQQRKAKLKNKVGMVHQKKTEMVQ